MLGDGGPGATVSGTQSNGTMRYNSLQAVLQKQMSQGLQYQVSYTFSKCMSDSTGYYGAWNNALSASAYWQNVYDQTSGVGAVLLRCYSRNFSLCHLRSALRPRQDVSQERQ